MKTLAEIYAKYSGPDCHTGSDKGSVHSYVETYARILEPYRTTASRVVEIGILTGHSLRMWEEYFTTPLVYGTDINDTPLNIGNLKPMVESGKHLISFFNACDPEQVNRFCAGNKFDVVIEDASHALSHQLQIYANFKPHMSANGIYIIEDIDNIDANRAAFECMDDSKKIEIIDLRHIKNRFDDVLVVIS